MYKTFYDPIYKYITFNDTIVKIIDTPHFQRLRHISQLGLSSYVFPSSSHTRFSHSLGAAHLAKEFIMSLKMCQPELNITERDVTLITVAALTHDIGHICYSHVMDHSDINNLFDDPLLKKHEERSKWLLRDIIETYNIGITEIEYIKICNMIDPPEHLQNSFMYQIVCNKVGSIDIDKIDYINRDAQTLGLPFSYDYTRIFKQARVINDEICFPEKEVNNIFELFELRYKLHNTIYQHGVTTAVELMFNDILNDLSDHVDLKKLINNPKTIGLFTDNMLTILDWNYNLQNKKCKILYDRIKERDIYEFWGDYDSIEEVKNIFGDNPSLELVPITMHFGKGNENPIDHIKFYRCYEPDKSFNIDLKKYTLTTPNKFQVKKIRVIKRT
jgi:HD superfamily phosphohydrolase